jgi:hypothetical protein
LRFFKSAAAASGLLCFEYQFSKRLVASGLDKNASGITELFISAEWPIVIVGDKISSEISVPERFPI